ncbi:MAG: efflux RND transporter periplasmic adaptor subunit [Elainellaceae cyanobacterium]
MRHPSADNSQQTEPMNRVESESERPSSDAIRHQSSKLRNVSFSYKRLITSKVGWGIVAFVLSACFLAVINVSRQFSRSDSLASPNVLFVETHRVELVESYQELRTYTGNIVAGSSSNIGFERPGTVMQLMVEAGDSVTAGMPLAFLDTRSLDASRQEAIAKRAQAIAQLEEMKAGPRTEEIAAAEASVENLQMQVELSRRISERRQELFNEGAISREQLEEATFETGALQARLAEAGSRLEELRAGTRREQIDAQEAVIRQLDATIANIDIDLDKSILKAPFDGTISERLVDEGTVVASGQTIFKLVEDSQLEARVGVPATAVNRLQSNPNQQLIVGETAYQATVTSVLPELDEMTRTLTVVFALTDPATPDISPGQVAKLELAEAVPTSGYWVPTTALIEGGSGLWSCYVLGESVDLDGTANRDVESAFPVEQVDLELLYTGSDRVLVRGTLQESDRVIVEGTHRLVPGQLVHPVDAS